MNLTRSRDDSHANGPETVHACDLTHRSGIASGVLTGHVAPTASKARRRGETAMLDAITFAELHHLRARVVFCELASGNAGESDVRARIVYVSAHLTPVEARCTVMHELAHIALQHTDFTGDDARDAPYEAAADEWAAERLIPDTVLAHARDRARDDREMAEHCGVDEHTMAARLRVADRRIPAQVVRLVRS